MVAARPDVAYAIKELSRKCSRPTQLDVIGLKRCLKYLSGTKGYVFNLTCEDAKGRTKALEVHTDSNWSYPKSTSGCHIVWNGTILMTTSRTQSVPALSSAEAEIIAANDAGKEGIFLQNVLEEATGQKIQIELYCDASAAICFAKRQGLGRVRHLQLRFLWLQEQVKDGRLDIFKVDTAENRADILTKAFSNGQQYFMLRWQLGVVDPEYIEE